MRHTLFETELGWIGIAWRAESGAIARLSLPAADRAATEAVLLRAIESDPSDDPPETVARVADALDGYARGERTDFSEVPVWLGDVGTLRESIYRELRRVAYGETLTYGQLAERIGFPGMAREIGQAMGRNPVPIIIPCHRVLAAGGRLGGFSAPGGVTTKERLLRLEQALAAPAQASFAF